jgi:Protein kinase domain
MLRKEERYINCHHV